MFKGKKTIHWPKRPIEGLWHTVRVARPSDTVGEVLARLEDQGGALALVWDRRKSLPEGVVTKRRLNAAVSDGRKNVAVVRLSRKQGLAVVRDRLRFRRLAKDVEKMPSLLVAHDPDARYPFLMTTRERLGQHIRDRMTRQRKKRKERNLKQSNVDHLTVEEFDVLTNVMERRVNRAMSREVPEAGLLARQFIKLKEFVVRAKKEPQVTKDQKRHFAHAWLSLHEHIIRSDFRIS